MRRIPTKIATFLFLVVSLYGFALWSSSKIRVGDHTLLQHLTGNPLAPGGRYQSLRRFREFPAAGKTDIIFFGSSHGYRGFDPRIFAEAGLNTYNLSSTNQTPLNSFYLAKEVLPSRAPSLVVFEVYYGSLIIDGLEAQRDLAVNMPASWNMMQMALATRHIGAINFSIAKALGLVADDTTAQQRTIPGETYVPGGYVESPRERSKLSVGGKMYPQIDPRQLDYLEEAAALVRSMGARVVWVTHPLPSDHVERVGSYPHMSRSIAELARRIDVPYWDFNDSMRLDPLRDFADFHHLSSAGVRQFNAALIERLRSSGLLPAP